MEFTDYLFWKAVVVFVAAFLWRLFTRPRR